MARLTKKERDFYNNIPNMAKAYYRENGVINVRYWHIYNGECDEVYEDLEGCEILNIIYYVQK